MKKFGLARALSVLFLFGIFAPLVHADATSDITGKICDVVHTVQFIAGAIALLVLVVLGIQFMAVGNNPIAREGLKEKIGLLVLGLFIIAIAPFIINLFLPNAASCPLL